MAEMKWTICSEIGGKIRKWAQYSDKARAEAHAKSVGGFVKLYPANPQRLAKLGGRRSCVQYRRVGLPQY